jgi:hypothetical protein
METDLGIKPNDVFSVGPHRFSCADIEMILLRDLLNMPENIYLVYSDPPWNAGNARMWRTLSEYDGSVGRKVDWDYFSRQIYIQIKSVNPTHVFIEMGSKQTSEVLRNFVEYGFLRCQNSWQVYYNSTHPNTVSYFSEYPGFTGNPDGMKNEPMTRHIFENIAKKGEVVFDPCIGLGMTARMAHMFDMICYGNDINPHRLQRTMKWIAQKTGHAIERIEEQH